MTMKSDNTAKYKDEFIAVGLKIGYLRRQRAMTQEQLADKIGVARQTIGLIEAGNYNPSISLCIEICKALNRTLDELFWPVE